MRQAHERALPTGELLGADFETVGAMQLYRASDALVAHRGAIEEHVFDAAMGVFGLRPTVTLYDLTNTCFEGGAEAMPKAARGHFDAEAAEAHAARSGGVVHLQRLKTAGGEARLRCFSPARAEKALGDLDAGLSRPRTRKGLGHVRERVGRLKADSRGAAAHYEVEAVPDAAGEKAAAVRWTRRPVNGSMATHPGVYCLRTNILDRDEAAL